VWNNVGKMTPEKRQSLQELVKLLDLVDLAVEQFNSKK
jgi:hypothetical protein